MKKYTLYKHICPNSKVYIGITAGKVNKRWDKGRGYQSQVFYRAIKKYGWENIEHEILLVNLTKEEAEIFEIEVIKHNKSNDRKHGYNIANGGNCKDKFSEETKNKISSNQPNRRKVINIDTKEIFDCIEDISKKYKVCAKNIIRCCKGRCNKTGGYVWRYIDENNNIVEPEKRQNKARKQIINLDNGKIYKSIAEASKETGVSIKNISSNLNGRTFKAGGIRWSFKENPTILKDRVNNRTIINVDTKEIFVSVKEASKAYKCSIANIYRNLKGIQEKANGYHWAYYSKGIENDIK